MVVLALSTGGGGLPSWAPFSSLGLLAETGQGMVREGQSTGPSGLRRVKGQPAGANPLQVLNPEQSQDEDDNVVVVDDSEKQLEDEEDKSSDSEDDKHSGSEDESGEDESDEEDRDGDVDPIFREQLMAVLQTGKALGGEDDDDEELGDEAMMALDENLASLFAEQKLRIQARRDEKNKLRKEKALQRDFQIRVSLRTGPASRPPCLSLRPRAWLSPPVPATGSGPGRGDGDQAA